MTMSLVLLMGVSMLETCSEEAALRLHGEVVERPTVNLLHHSRSREAAHRYKVRLFNNVNPTNPRRLQMNIFCNCKNILVERTEKWHCQNSESFLRLSVMDRVVLRSDKQINGK